MDVYERIQAAVAEVCRRLPEATVTWDEVENRDANDIVTGAFKDVILCLNRSNATIRALAQKLSDSPCPVCRGSMVIRLGPGGPSSRPMFCGRCGEFPEPRQGRFAIDAADALRRVSEKSYY